MSNGRSPADPLEEWLQDYQERRRERVRRVAERSGSQPLWNEALRVLYITGAILFDGLILGEILYRLEDPWRWVAFLPTLAVAVWVQYRVYRHFWPKGWDGDA